MGTRLTPIAFDIETTGFDIDARVTVLGLALPLGCRVFLNTGGTATDTEQLEASLNERFEPAIQLSVHDTETETLEGFATCVADAVAPEEYMLVAYNGERYRGGFDLPFLRTRYALLELPWPFDAVPYADLLPIFEARFNTTISKGEANDLPAVYETLVGDGLTDADPFTDSEQAVGAFEDGSFESLVAHNIADILRTDALAHLAQEFCGKSEFKLKSLTPTARDPALGTRDR